MSTGCSSDARREWSVFAAVACSTVARHRMPSSGADAHPSHRRAACRLLGHLRGSAARRTAPPPSTPASRVQPTVRERPARQAPSDRCARVSSTALDVLLIAPAARAPSRASRALRSAGRAHQRTKSARWPRRRLRREASEPAPSTRCSICRRRRGTPRPAGRATDLEHTRTTSPSRSTPGCCATSSCSAAGSRAISRTG